MQPVSFFTGRAVSNNAAQTPALTQKIKNNNQSPCSFNKFACITAEEKIEKLDEEFLRMIRVNSSKIPKKEFKIWIKDKVVAINDLDDF